jgi:hypothetical protein
MVKFTFSKDELKKLPKLKTLWKWVKKTKLN